MCTYVFINEQIRIKSAIRHNYVLGTIKIETEIANYTVINSG